MKSGFECASKKNRQFETDFMSLVKSNVPFFALEQSLVELMDKRGHSFFDIPPHKTFSGKWLRFHFTTKSSLGTKLYTFDRVEYFNINPSK